MCLLWAAGTDGSGFPRQPSIDISAHVSILFDSSVVVNTILSFFLFFLSIHTADPNNAKTMPKCTRVSD